MSHVTINPADAAIAVIAAALDVREAEMMKLVNERREIIARFEKGIDQANRDFDRKALLLGKEINELREQVPHTEPAAKTSARKSVKAAKPITLDGLDNDEQAHYRRLLESKNGQQVSSHRR